MIVDNLGKERRCLGEYLPEVFETCLANFLHYLLLVYSFYICFLWENQLKFLPLHIINL